MGYYTNIKNALNQSVQIMGRTIFLLYNIVKILEQLMHDRRFKLSALQFGFERNTKLLML